MKKADQLVGVTGTNVLVLAGGVQVVCESGEVVDVSAGTVVPSGSALVKDHRYMVAENGRAVFTVTSKTAVLDYQGPYEFCLSQEVDYPAMAAALKTLHLFQGSFTGYGQGFDLEAAPTRLQALIMFIRVLGEEEQALAWSGQQPFKDIAKGTTAEKYVGYAYAKGYTNGYSATQFKPAGAVNAYQYTEFLLRAMGYSSASNTDLWRHPGPGPGLRPAHSRRGGDAEKIPSSGGRWCTSPSTRWRRSFPMAGGPWRTR